MVSKLYKAEDIDDYMNRLTKEQAEELLEHCNGFGIFPEICAWYDCMEDFYTDWVYDHKVFSTEDEADERYKEGTETGEFKKFKSGEIVRLVV